VVKNQQSRVKIFWTVEYVTLDNLNQKKYDTLLSF
jgi:hypothetical protein